MSASQNNASIHRKRFRALPTAQLTLITLSLLSELGEVDGIFAAGGHLLVRI